ncbi:DinB family protein [Rudanella paleaurantiibacter]|uniref:DinB family protein n=1 Tax=Rudanella paleaurantiibacter TaxID=2614655 RepID=A0A7J5TWM5_9BACT|nr:DinB family protein [Rudanella paleaurantiibacter]KAB7727672.1 DinB family protein [Rudanella paleaurantiibacter]
MTGELLANLWRINQASAQGPINKLTPENYQNRLTPETASAGFIALHAAEAMHNFAQIIFGRPVTIKTRAVGGVSDTGQPIDLDELKQFVTDSFALIAEQISALPDEQWTEEIQTPFGVSTRMGVLAFLMHHNSYHAGQIAQAAKKGSQF